MNFTIIVSSKRIRDKRAAPNIYDARLIGEDKILCSSNTVYLDTARLLLKSGRAKPQDTLIMRHAGSGTDALTATIGDAANLSVEERDAGPHSVRFVPWKPMAVLHRPTAPPVPPPSLSRNMTAVLATVRKNSVEGAEVATPPK